MLWTMIVTGCLGFGPCKDFTIDTGQQTKQACEVLSQLALVDFALQHPKWRIARWKCVPPGHFVDL